MKGFLCKLLSCLGFGKACSTENRRTGPESRRCANERRDPQPRRNEDIKDRRDHHEH